MTSYSFCSKFHDFKSLVFQYLYPIRFQFHHRFLFLNYFLAMKFQFLQVHKISMVFQVAQKLLQMLFQFQGTFVKQNLYFSRQIFWVMDSFSIKLGNMLDKIMENLSKYRQASTWMSSWKRQKLYQLNQVSECQSKEESWLGSFLLRMIRKDLLTGPWSKLWANQC